MDLKNYFQPIIKWWWMLLIACLLASVSSFIITRRQPPIYQSHTSLMIGQSINNPNPAQTQFYLEQQLAQIYAGIGMREPVKDGTMKALGLAWLPDYRVVAIPNSQLVDILVTDTNPERAQAVAAELAHQLILRSPTVGQVDDLSQQEFVRTQLENLQSQIKSTQEEIDKSRQEMGNLNSARQIADKENEITALENKLNLLEGNYATMLGNSKQGAPNSLSVVEPAEIPKTPVGPNWVLSVAMSAVISLALAAIGAYALEFLDPTFRNVSEVTKILPYPILGHIAEISKKADPFLYVAKDSHSPISDAFRMVKTGMEAIGLGQTVRSVLFLSSGSREGKTTISSNIAATVAKTGKQVILVDADLRKASLSKAFDMSDCEGLGDVLMGKAGINEVIRTTNLDNLMFVPAGAMIADHDYLFDSANLDSVLAQLETLADIVIYDSPPAFISDAVALIRRIHHVVYIISIGRSRRDMAKQFMDQISAANAEVMGMILNRMPIGTTYYGKRYGDYNSYFIMSKKNQANSNGHQGKTAKERTLFPK